MPDSEIHNTHRVGWLRAAVLGANDGIVSTASLVLGVAAAGTSSKGILIAGIAGLVAGAMSMAAGEYVSVSSQADAERADLNREQKELATRPKQEHKELTAIYVDRGLDPGLASNVATQLMAHDALGAHARDELGISDAFTARPIQAAFASAIAFSVGAALPLAIVLLVPVSDTHVGGIRQCALVSRTPRRHGGTHRRRFDGHRCCAGSVLGGPSHGFDRWSWCLVWGRCMRSHTVLGLADDFNVRI